ncbi:MAG: hypothetical protein H8E37_06815 [Planctomycetes bacterium]|nr:hypothetical protein [Planctomycetota bacterium]
MGLSKAAQNRLDEQLVFDDPDFEERLRVAGRPLLSDGRGLREAELVELLTGNGIPMDRVWLWKVTRQFPSSESLAHWLFGHNEIAEAEFRIHPDWVWVAVDCLWDRWCPNRPRFEGIERTIQEGYIAREFAVAETCQMWLRAWDQIQQLYTRFRFDTIDDFDECLAGLVAVPAWAQDLLALLRAGIELDSTFLSSRMRVCEELVEFCRDCYDGEPSSVLLKPMQDELARTRTSAPTMPERRAA